MHYCANYNILNKLMRNPFKLYCVYYYAYLIYSTEISG
jgi:hypothetical protein